MNIKMHKIIIFVLAFVLALPMIALSVSADEGGDTVVLYTNDIHANINKFPLLAAYKGELLSDGTGVITVDAGDAIQGEAVATLTKGGSVVDIMNKVGYDYATLGNHEFDYEVPRILEIAESEAQYEYLCANFYDILADKTAFAPYAIKGINGIKIAFVGISTPETYSKSTPTYFQDENGNYIYSFMEDDLYSAVQSAVDSALADGADYVIAIGHLGISDVTNGYRSSDVVANTVGIDVFIDGHAHEVISGDVYKNKNGGEVIITSTGTKLENIGKLTILKSGEIKTELVKTDEIDVSVLSDTAKESYDSIKGIVDGYNAEFEYLFEEIGYSETLLTTKDKDGNRLVRSGETNMGDFVTDAYRALSGADIAFVNGGGVRADIPEGTFTRKALMDVSPWGNEMCVIEVTGAQILDALEYGMYLYPSEHGSFPQVSGITFEVHTYVDTPVTVDSIGDFVSINNDMPRRVRNVKVGGTDIDINKTYSLVGTRYMLQLSGYKMLSGAKELSLGDCPKTDAEALIKYTEEILGGRITAKQYGNIAGDGRISMIDKEPSPNAGDDAFVELWISIAVMTTVFGMALMKKRA